MIFASLLRSAQNAQVKSVSVYIKMKKTVVFSVMVTGLLLASMTANAQYKDGKGQEETPKTESELILEKAKSSETPVVITLE